MSRYLLPCLLLLSLCLPALADDAPPSILKYQADPMTVFSMTDNALRFSREIPVSELPPTPATITQIAPNGAVMIEYKGKQLWFSPMDVNISVTKNAGGSVKRVGASANQETYAINGIGENN